MLHGRLPEVRAGYTIQEVPFGLKSDSVIIPDNPLRSTQTNIGHFLAKFPTLAEESYGVHKNEYSGTGGTKVSIDGHENFVARKKQHIRTGIHGSPSPPISQRCMANRILGNVGLFATDINKIGPQLFEISRSVRSEPLPKLAEKSIFPRSIVYELEYTKALTQKAMLEALEREVAILEEKFSSKNIEEEKKQQKTSNEDKGLCELSPKKREKDLTVVAPCKSTCGMCGCTLTRGECPKCCRTESKTYEIGYESTPGWKGDSCKQSLSKEPKYSSSWGEERKAELLRVGYPFATEIADWLYCAVPPFDSSQFYRPSKKKFPERSFSSLLI